MPKKIIRSGHTKFIVFGQHQVREKIGRRQSKQRKHKLLKKIAGY